MKKNIALILLTSLSLFLSGCASIPPSTEEVSVNISTTILSEPPRLVITSGDNTVECSYGTASWSYSINSKEQEGFESCGIHPLDGQEYLTPFTTSQSTATLAFAVEPDEISVQCWSDANWGNTSAESESVSLHSNQLDLRSGGYIYEIRATWNSHEQYGGSAYYTAYIVTQK